MRTSYSIDIDAAPQKVFFWLDDPDRVMQWILSLVENEQLEETDNKIGSTFRQVVDEDGRRVEVHGTVTGYEPDRRLAIHLEAKGFTVDVDYRLQQHDGGTRLTQVSDVKFRGFMRLFGWLLAPIAKKAAKKQQAGDFARLKGLCEGDA